MLGSDEVFESACTTLPLLSCVFCTKDYKWSGRGNRLAFLSPTSCTVQWKHTGVSITNGFVQFCSGSWQSQWQWPPELCCSCLLNRPRVTVFIVSGFSAVPLFFCDQRLSAHLYTSCTCKHEETCHILYAGTSLGSSNLLAHHLAFWWHACAKYLGSARTIYIRCKYGIFGKAITKFTVIYGAYIQFWPTLQLSAFPALQWTLLLWGLCPDRASITQALLPNVPQRRHCQPGEQWTKNKRHIFWGQCS
jgi:hypothetical protein